MRRDGSDHLTPEQATELQALAVLPEAAIDTRELPEQRDWSGARRGLFFRPVQQQLLLCLDADLIAWFKARAPAGGAYQTGINDALRAYVEEHGAE